MKGCTGCAFNINVKIKTQFCFFQAYKMINECPCKDCLVKVMCRHTCMKRAIPIYQKLQEEDQL